MSELIKGWKAALAMCSKSAKHYSAFNECNFQICEKKGREMPANLKELDKLLWKAFRAGQEDVASSILSSIKWNDWTQYLEEEADNE